MNKLSHLSITILLLIIIQVSGHAQSISRSVIASGGTEQYSISNYSIESTFGEMIIEDFDGPYLLTQGFQQGDLSEVSFPETPDITATVFPNPFDEMLDITVRLDAEIEMRVYNILGQMVYAVIPDTENFTIPTTDWGTGVYLVNFTAGGKRLYVEKVIKHVSK